MEKHRGENWGKRITKSLGNSMDRRKKKKGKIDSRMKIRFALPEISQSYRQGCRKA